MNDAGRDLSAYANLAFQGARGEDINTAQFNLGASHKFELGSAGDLTLRMDMVNVFDRIHQIRDGTGVGVGASQYGPRRGIFFGISKSI